MFAIVSQDGTYSFYSRITSGIVKGIKARYGEALGARAWTWTDYPAWRPRENFVRQMPKSVLQSAWWYPVMSKLITCSDPRMFIKAGLFADLEKMGYDQVPCGGNCSSDKNMAEIVKMGDAVIRGGRLRREDEMMRRTAEGELYRPLATGGRICGRIWKVKPMKGKCHV